MWSKRRHLQDWYHQTVIESGSNLECIHYSTRHLYESISKSIKIIDLRWKRISNCFYVSFFILIFLLAERTEDDTKDKQVTEKMVRNTNIYIK